MLQNLSSAAAVIGALRVKLHTVLGELLLFMSSTIECWKTVTETVV